MNFRTFLLAGVSVALVVTCVVWAQGPGAGGRLGAPGGPGGAFEPRSPVVNALDANGDGELSAEEIAGASKVLKALDKNGDGKLGRDEMRPQGAGRGGAGGPGGPGGRGAGGFGGLGGRGGMGPQGGGQPAGFETSTLAKDDGERKILKAMEDINQKQGRMLNVPVPDGRLLRLLAEAIDAKNVVEFGTSNGISGLWFGLALRKTGGKLITHELEPRIAAMARENFASAGIADLVTVVEGNAHETASKLKGPIDVVFIDADKEGYLDYLQKVLPLVRPGGLILAHNMNPRMANPAFVKAITTNAELETLFYSDGGGVSVTLKKR
ncbi:MAG: O-methyltransferase [Pirellulales bacterium]